MRPFVKEFARTYAIGIGIAAVVVPAIMIVITALIATIGLPTYLWHFLEFGMMPWEVGFLHLDNVPLTWQTIQVIWMVLVIVGMLSALHAAGKVSNAEYEGDES